MDPSSDSPLHFHHHRQGQRHQPLGSSQASGSMSTPASSHSQGPASPSASTAASSNPFVRSHHDDLPADVSEEASESAIHHLRYRLDSSRMGSSDPTPSINSALDHDEGAVAVAIKCPSLDRDSAVVRVQANDTVLALKQIIQETWAGAPRADGMRCIRSGRILSNDEMFSQLTGNLEAGEPLSLHLVIRPDAWSDPQNRPTPSRRSSYLRQQQQQLQHQRQHDLPRSALATQVSSQGVIADDVPSPQGATSTQLPSAWTPTFEPYFGEPGPVPARSGPGAPRSDDDHVGFASSSNILNDMIGSNAAQHGADAYTVLEETLRVTAPDNWPLLVEALSEAYDEYVVMYECIYNDARAAQKADATASAVFSSSLTTQSELLTSIETSLLGWDPVRLPGQNCATAASTNTNKETQYLYQQVSHRGLPYLLRISTTPLAMQRSAALATLLQRITTLGNMVDKLENVIMLGRLIQTQTLNHPSAPGVSGATASTQNSGAAAANERAAALEQGGVVAGVARISQRVREAFRGITFADITAVIIPMTFMGFKVGILLSVMLRGADKFKWYFILGMTFVYVVFESYRIVQRRMRVRQRMAPRPAAPPAPPLQQEGQAGPPVEGNAVQPGPGGAGTDIGAGAAAAPAPTPLGANVPSAPSNEEAVERQATEDPLRPLPPPQAPPRIRSRTRFSYDWWIEHMAFIGLDVEDAELGLIPAAGTQRRAFNWVESTLISNWLLPILLFTVTMMPAVEQRRKRAIEERERVIRKWTRLEEERRQRVVELQQKQAAEERDATTIGGLATSEGPSLKEGETELQSKRAEYADRMLRQRTTTEAADMDEEEAVRLARELQREEEEGGMEDMNIF